MLAAGVFVLAMAWFSLTWTATFEPRDEGYLLAQSQRVLAGELPHRDFTDVYGPGALTVTAALLAAGEGDVRGVRIAIAVWKALAVVLAFLLARGLVGRPWALLGALAAAAFWGRLSWNLNTPYASLYTVPLLLLAAAVLAAAESRGSARGRFLAGAVAGSAVLFKQTLGLMGAYGLGLAVAAVALLEARGSGSTSRGNPAVLGLWAVAAIAPLVAVAGYLSATTYAVHFLPLHAWMACIAVGAARRGNGLTAGDLVARLLPYGLGLAVLPGLAALYYAMQGALDAMLHDMFVLPRSLVNYALPLALPPWGAFAVLAAGACAIAAPPLALRGTPRAAGVALFAAAALAWVGSQQVSLARMLTVGPALFEPVQLALIAALGLAVFGPSIGSGRVSPALPALVFTHLLLCFQGFPRGGVDVYLTQGAQMPLLAVALGTVGARLPTTPSRRLGGVALSLALAWLAFPAAQGVVQTARAPLATRALALPGFESVHMPTRVLREFEIDDLERLAAALAIAEPADAALVHFHHDLSLAFASSREDLFADRRARLFWVAWDMLPASEIAKLEEDLMIERLAATPDAIVVDRHGEGTERLRRALPKFATFLDVHYQATAQMGPYRTLRRKPEPTP